MYTVEIDLGASASKYWASLRFEDKKGIVHTKQIEDERKATKNSNYLQALIEAVGELNRPCMLDIHTSCEYIVETYMQGWIVNWEKNGWLNARGNTVRNAEQWQQVRKALAPHSVRFLYPEGRAK